METGRRITSRRAWVLALAAGLAGIALGVAAAILDGALRAPLAAASIVCAVTAAFCVATVLLETSDSPPIDLEAPPAELPIPESPVALVHDPGKPTINGLESDALKTTRASS